jgi:hypothetical protein
MLRARVMLTALSILFVQPKPAIPSPPQEGTVVVHGWVEKGDGMPAATLDPADFTAEIDDAPAPILSIAPKRLPVSVIVLLDTSRSVRWWESPPANLGRFAGLLTPSDRIMIATFGARISFPGFTLAGRDMDGEIRSALEISDAEGFGKSPVWDAIYGAVEMLSREPGPRSILLLTDGRTTGNTHGLVETAAFAMANRVSINVILRHSSESILQGGGGTAALVQPGAPIQGLATYTGGLYFTYPERQTDITLGLFRLIAASLVHMQEFTLQLPKRDGRAHRFAVRSAKIELKVHAPMAFLAR